LNHPDLKVENSSIAKKFRQRFRVPPKILFDVLVPLCEGIFSTGGKRCFPIELKIMVSLRILGRDAVADDCNELCGIGGSTCNAIFKQFVKGFSKRDYHQFIRIPTCNSDELLRTMEVYRKLGFPGCFGSMDVTHVRWNRCPKLLKHEHLGKEGYPFSEFSEFSVSAIASGMAKPTNGFVGLTEWVVDRRSSVSASSFSVFRRLRTEKKPTRRSRASVCGASVSFKNWPQRSCSAGLSSSAYTSLIWHLQIHSCL
jgi:hypothetical protein